MNPESVMEQEIPHAYEDDAEIEEAANRIADAALEVEQSRVQRLSTRAKQVAADIASMPSNQIKVVADNARAEIERLTQSKVEITAASQAQKEDIEDQFSQAKAAAKSATDKIEQSINELQTRALKIASDLKASQDMRDVKISEIVNIRDRELKAINMLIKAEEAKIAALASEVLGD